MSRGQHAYMACGRICVSLLPIFHILRRLAMYPMRRCNCPQPRDHQAYIGPRDTSHLDKIGQCLGFRVAQRSVMVSLMTARCKTSPWYTSTVSVGAVLDTA